MIGVDTNVLVRLLTGDEAQQAAEAKALTDSLSPTRRGYVSRIVLVETYWVLTRAYGLPPREVVDQFVALTQSPDVVVDAPQDVVTAARRVQEGVDFPDALIDAEARRAGCSAVASFDQRAQKRLRWVAPVSITNPTEETDDAPLR